MATEYADRANEIKGVLDAIDGVGVVHNRIRLATEWGRFLELFKAPDGTINGWDMTRQAGDPQPPFWEEVWMLRHYRGLRDEDATDLTFQAHLDEVIRAFRDLPNLTFGSVPQGLKIIETDERMMGSVLCHYAECELRIALDYDQL